MQALRARGFSGAPAVVPATTGDIIVEWRGRMYSLYEWIDSDRAFNWTEGGWSRAQARAAGLALGEFHRAADGVGVEFEFAESGGNGGEREWALAVLQRASGLFPDDVMIALSNFEDLLRSARIVASDERTHGVIHGDYHPGNVLFRGEEVVGVLDYEYCRRDSQLFDVAYATMTFSFESMDAAFGLAFLDGYAERFERLEMKQLQPLVRLSAWLSGVWLIEQCQKGAAAHDEVLSALRKCMAIVSATLD
jgi:Ser/Thr protein kinase RdoA (MazF antagonist)